MIVSPYHHVLFLRGAPSYCLDKSTICSIYLLSRLLKPCVHLPQMGARTTCRVVKSDNMLLLYFKLIFTTTHHFQLFGGSIEKPDVNLLRHCSFTPSQSSPSCDPQQVPVSRSKRKVDQSKTSCLLHLHADYRFYKRFGSVEAVVAQVSSHSAQKIHSTLI